jgi:hypothetical protein
VTVTLHLPPEIEHGLIAEAEARGVSIDVLLEMVLRQFTFSSGVQSQEPTVEGQLVRLDDGMWALRTGHPISADTVDDTIEAVRRERDFVNLGTPR